MAIVQGAQAVIKAYADMGIVGGIIMAGLVGLQAAYIAGEEMPEFSAGTRPEGFIVPPGYEHDNFPILVSSGERVDVTPANQLSRYNENRLATNQSNIVNNYYSVNLTINLHVQALKNSGEIVGLVKWGVEEGLRRSGLPVNRYFLDPRTRVMQ
jgi:hypothetical protein